jgi:serpin B
VAGCRTWLVPRAAVVVGLAALLAGSTVVTPDAALVRAAPPPSPPASPESDVAAAVRGSTALALTLYQRLGSGDENLVASPSSLATVLAMALPGARGRTADEIAHVLHTTLDPGRLAAAMGTLDAGISQRASASSAELDVSNALWSQRGYTIRTTYLQLLAGAFGTGVHQADFIADVERARLAINALVQEQTKEKIKDLFAPGSLNEYTPRGADQRDLPEGTLAAALRPARHPAGALPHPRPWRAERADHAPAGRRAALRAG